MSFDNPPILIGFLGFIPLSILGVFHYRQGRRGLDYLVPPPLVGKDALVRALRSRYFCSGISFGLFVGCLLMALAGPRWGKRIVPEYHRGVDVVLALDVSRSMDVRDGDISRLDQALGIARDLVGTSGGIRLGTALGKGKGVLAVPLTYDTGAVLTFLEGLTGSSLTGRGTNLETLLDAASGAFQNTLPTRRVIILFSDGESLSGSLAAAIDRAMDSGITMTAVGMGTEAGGLVPQEADPLSLDGALRDEAEALLMSYRRGDVLRDAAERTGGIYVDGNRNDAAGLLADYIRSLAPESGVNGYHLENSPQWRFFVIAALLFLGVSKLFEKRPRKRRR